MKKIVGLVVTCILVVFALVGVFYFSDTTYADTTAPVYHVYINQFGKISRQQIGQVTYTIVQNALYRVDAATIDNYVSNYNCDSFAFYNTQSQQMTIIGQNLGAYQTRVTSGTFSYVEIYNEYLTITYNLYGGVQNTANPDAFYKNGSTFNLHQPTRAGFVFGGWFRTSDYSTSSVTSITPSQENGNVTLHAKWFGINSLNVNILTHDNYNLIRNTVDICDYHLNDISNQYRYDNKLLTLTETYNKPNINVLNFLGAPLSIIHNLGIIYSFSSAGSPSEIVLFDNYYTITYHLNGATFDSTSIAYYDTPEELSLIQSPRMPSKVFVGWYLDEEYSTPLFPLNGSFECRNLDLYPLFEDEIDLPVNYRYTDYYTENTDIVDTVYAYRSSKLNMYVYGDNLLTKQTELNTLIKVLDEQDNEITINSNNGKYYSSTQYTPSKILLYTDYYSITYHPNGGTMPATYISYYDDYSQIIDNLPTPICDNKIFVSWYKDEAFTQNLISSSFNNEDLALYAKWEDKIPIKVYYYNDTQEDGVYEEIGTTYCYKILDSFYNFGTFDNTTDQLGLYLKRYDVTSFEIIDENENIIPATTSNGKLLCQITDKTPFAARIYKHYTTKFYVNGNFIGIRHAKAENSIEPCDDVVGFIGKNYEALNIGSFTIGNRYAIYLFKGWSYTDTSDKTWFDKTEVELISSWNVNDDKIYIKNVYAYMTFYSKLSERNSLINYENYISETKGIITKDSQYTIDELLKEHAVEISSDTQLSTFDKIARALNLGKTSPLITLLEKVFDNKSVGFKELWQNISGKITILLFSVVSFIILLYLVIPMLKKAEVI